MSEDGNINSKLNLKDIFFAALNKWYLLCILLAVSVIASLFYSYFIVTPLYKSTGKIYLTNKDEEKISTSEIAISSYLTKDYENLITDRAVLDEVSAKLGRKYSYEELKRAVSIDNPEDTRFLEITVTTASPNDSKKIVDTVCAVAQEKIIELLGVNRVTIVRNGNVPNSPCTPNINLNIIKSIVIGIFIYAVIIVANILLNDKVNGPDDVEKYLGISVLGNIPYQSKSKPKK